ncbi:MAG: sialate O-acetylesterase [Flavisolibacter sp.]|nr:sialate O-acetylesterase [Flavisolibacter sp.]
MRRNAAYSFPLILLAFISCTTRGRGISSGQEKSDRNRYFPKSIHIVEKIPRKENIWVFILAGQSNMAGRGFVEPQDTLPAERVLTITANGQLVLAKEPLHFYEPTLTGLDCGLSFGKHLIQYLPDSISVLLIPTAVGGSSVSQWLGDSLYRNVQLLSNFREKVQIGKKYGQVKAVLWHQGESDANANDIPHYKERLSALFKQFRVIVGNESLPILIGELGSFSKDPENWRLINQAVKNYCATDSNTVIISTADLKDKGDKIHFNSEGQRILGLRFANAYLQRFK